MKSFGSMSLRTPAVSFALLFGDTLKIEASRGLDESEKQRGLYRMGEGITGHVAERGVSHVIPDLRKRDLFRNL